MKHEFMFQGGKLHNINTFFLMVLGLTLDL